MKRAAITVAAIFFVGISLGYFLFLPLGAEKYFGRGPALIQPPFQVSDHARELHERLFVVDLHADSIIWSRDLLERSERGHLDIPRMIDGGIGLQTFMAAVDGPFDPSRESIETGGLDQVFFLALLDRWPFATVRSVKARALYVAAALRSMTVRPHRVALRPDPLRATTPKQLIAHRRNSRNRGGGTNGVGPRQPHRALRRRLPNDGVGSLPRHAPCGFLKRC